MPVTCFICLATVPDVPDAIAAGWVPSFFDPAIGCESDGPACDRCARERLVYDPEYDDFALSAPTVIVGTTPNP